MADIVDNDMLDSFLAALPLKNIPKKKLKSLMEPTIAQLSQRGPPPPAADQIPSKDTYDVFVSHATKDGKGVFEAVRAYMDGKDLKVFNPTTMLAHVEKPSTAAMQDYARRSKIVLAVLSEEFFKSKWCQAEIYAAMEAGKKVVPVFAGDDYNGKQVHEWVNAFKSHEVYGYVFKQNAMDVKNEFNATQVKSSLDALVRVHMS